MAVRQIRAGGAISAKVSAIFAGTALLLAPVATTCSAARDTAGTVAGEKPSIFTNGKTTIRISGARVKLESTERGGYWSMEAKIKSVREVGGIMMLIIDPRGAEMGGIVVPADALTVNNMTDAGAPEGKVSIIIMPDSESLAGMKVRMVHEFTHALVSGYVNDAGLGRPSETVKEAIAYAAQIAYGDAHAGFDDLLGTLAMATGEDRVVERVARNLVGELAASLGKDPRSAGGRELRDAALAFLDKICMHEFGVPFAQVADTSLYSNL
ncbi:MAG: hypothetical protein WC350_00070 [Candidatus Micrarchaeia archaeon]